MHLFLADRAHGPPWFERALNLIPAILHVCRVLRQVFKQIQRLVHTAGMAGVGRPHNELALLQLQRQHERQEDKARLRVQQGLLSGPDSQRQRGFPQTEQTQFRPEASDARRELPGAARPGGLGATVLTSLLQRHHSSVSTYLSTYLPTHLYLHPPNFSRLVCERVDVREKNQRCRKTDPSHLRSVPRDRPD